MTKPKEKKLATLTVEEDKIWVNYFGFYLDAGYTDDSACNLAWRDLVKEFPRLKKIDGATAGGQCSECGFFKKDHRPGHWCKKFKELGK